MFIRIMLSTGVFKHSCFIHQIVYYIFLGQTFGHNLLLEEQSGTKNTFKEGPSQTLPSHEELNKEVAIDNRLSIAKSLLTTG